MPQIQLSPSLLCGLSYISVEQKCNTIVQSHTRFRLKSIFYHRRSIAERGGCFQRRLFVSVFVRTITSERLNVERSNLAVRYVVQKSRPSSKVKVKGQGQQEQKTKNCWVIPTDNAQQGLHHRRYYAASSNRQYHCVAARRWRATPVGKSKYLELNLVSVVY